MTKCRIIKEAINVLLVTDVLSIDIWAIIVYTVKAVGKHQGLIGYLFIIRDSESRKGGTDMSISVVIDWKFCLGVAAIIGVVKMSADSIKEAAVRAVDVASDKVAAKYSVA
ncbi:MAG: hypothetical protein IJR17_06495 [Clostridia bacterium]|nr:hypothetical protein [Clostridia bacterium]